jgi:3'-phosphoadenosine 5'-phosphosulfate sulfotransferase (PAPS reductase)/FAD synthetase
MTEVKHVLGISGGKDSAALALYLNSKYNGEIPFEYYYCDTGKELDETYRVLDALGRELGGITVLEAAADSHVGNPFDHFLALYGGYLPSSQARWCTKKLKLLPFEQFVGDDPTVSYVGIRGDEEREGYISRKSNIQSIFPFRKNIWSEDVIKKVLANELREEIAGYYQLEAPEEKLASILFLVNEPVSHNFNQKQKLNALLDLGVATFNRVVFRWLKTTDYPVGMLESFPLIENEDVLVREDVFRILRESTVGVPGYYEKREFEVDGQKGYYARSRSGCFFCFFQQKIEWVWLYENHPELFAQAMDYEKEGYSWMDSETLKELIHPERVRAIKLDAIKRSKASENAGGDFLLDVLEDAEGVGCAACFI